MALHALLGYLVAGLAAISLLLALIALLPRSEPAGRLMVFSFIACGIAQLPALATGVVDNAGRNAVAAANVAPFNFFFAASLFTLTCVLAAWRLVNPHVVWDKDKWLTYQAAALGNILLSVALILLGRMA